MTTSYVKIKATTTAGPILAASNAAVFLAAVGSVLIVVAAFVGAPWLGYAYDYFAENYTTVTT